MTSLYKSLTWGYLRESRKLGIHIVAGKGTGKSRFMGRLLSFSDFLNDIPTIIIDPVGQTINNFLDAVGRLPGKHKVKLRERIRYVDMAGRNGYVVPTPLYYRQGDEGLSDSISRPIELMERTDPKLAIAPVQGMNAIRYIGKPLGIVLSALGYQITEASALIADPESFKRRLQNPDSDTVRAINLLTREKLQAAMFKVKFADFNTDIVNRAMFGASQWGISWDEVVNNNLCVLIDVSRGTDTYMRRLKMVWLFQSFVAYIQQEGLKREKPISRVIDELAAMYRIGDETFSKEMDELIQVKSRNANVWLTLAHQEMSQFDDLTRKTLMSCGIQVIGRTDDPETARDYAHRFYPFDEDWIRSITPKMLTQSVDGTSFPVQVGEDIKHFNADEQERLNMPRFMNLPPMHFFVKFADSQRLHGLKLDSDDVTKDISLETVENDKTQLMKRDGRKIEDIEKEIQARLSGKQLPLSAEPLDYEAPPGYDLQDRGTDDEDPLFQAPRA